MLVPYIYPSPSLQLRCSITCRIYAELSVTLYVEYSMNGWDSKSLKKLCSRIYRSKYPLTEISNFAFILFSNICFSSKLNLLSILIIFQAFKRCFRVESARPEKLKCSSGSPPGYSISERFCSSEFDNFFIEVQITRRLNFRIR